MNKFARLPAEDSPGRRRAEAARPAWRSLYFAFLSYSHKDSELADWLHRELEEFRVPTAIAGRLTDNGVAPRRLSPIFRDQHELAAADDLGEEIETALACSQFLIVLCSPDAAKSRWTNTEVETFKRNRPDGCVLAAIASGEPFASQIPGREAEECFPPALRQKFDRRGRPTGRLAEPLAADFRDADGRRLALLKLIAGMLGVALDELVQRQATSRNRRLAWLAAASLAGMALTSALAVTAVQSRNEAREQRREAEGLVAFMLGDLKDKLEPIGRLDALDGVGKRILAYYSHEDASELSDAALSQRAQALSLMAQVASSRGDFQSAAKLYREAMAGTQEAIRRSPDDPQRLFDHAQNVFYYGQMMRSGGHLDVAEAAMRDYRGLAQRMVAVDPNNMKWRVEQQDADANLGIVLFDRRQFPEAVALLRQAAQMTQAFATADPGNAQFPQDLADGLAWLADAEMSDGQLAQATAVREQQVALLAKLIARPQSDVEYRSELVPAHQNLGWLYLMRGQTDLGLQHFRAAVAAAAALLPVEPTNRWWQELTAIAHLSLGQALLKSSKLAEATAENEAACRIYQSLLSRDSSHPSWRAGVRNCWRTRADLALAAHRNDEAVIDAQRSVAIGETIGSSDPVADKYALAQAYLTLGNAEQARHRGDAAAAAWQRATTEVSGGAPEKPLEMNDHAAILMRLGRSAEAQQLRQRLDAAGFHYDDQG